MIVLSPNREVQIERQPTERRFGDPRALGSTVCCVCEAPLTNGNHHCKGNRRRYETENTDLVAEMLSPEYLHRALLAFQETTEDGLETL